MWAIARFDLGLSGAEFGRLNHRLLGALTERFHRRSQGEDWRFGLLCSVAANAAGGKGKGIGFAPEDFFPSLRIARKPPSAKAMHAWADMMNCMQNARAAMAAENK